MMLKAPPNIKKIKEISDIEKNMLRTSIGAGFKFDYLILKNL